MTVALECAARQVTRPGVVRHASVKSGGGGPLARRCDQQQHAARFEDVLNAERDAVSRRGAPGPSRFEGGPGRGREFRHVRTAVPVRAGLVEGDVSVRSHSEHAQIDAAARDQCALVAAALGLEIRRGAVEQTHLRRAQPAGLDEMPMQHGGEARGVRRGDAAILVQVEDPCLPQIKRPQM